MNGLLQIRTAVIAALKQAGLSAGAAFSGTAPYVTGTEATVQVAGAAEQGAGFGCYLGQSCDESGRFTELYGRRIQAEILIEIRSPRADACEEGMETAAEALLHTLPSGLRPGNFKWEAVRWEPENRLFLRRGTLSCRAFFTAERNEASEALLEFTLKGVMDG